MVQIITFGCRANFYDSKVLEKEFQDQDVIIVNTCAVTQEAERQCRQTVRKLARENPNKKVIVTGCSSANDPLAYIDYTVLPRVDVSSLPAFDFDTRVRAFIPIQTGCNNQCTYCIIHVLRGSAVSFNEDVILQSIGEALKSVSEIVLTGIDIASYTDLPCLIKKILKTFPQLQRLRLGSFDPAKIDAQLIDLFKTEPRLMPHIHLSMQHGSNSVLKKMARRHQTGSVLLKLEKLRSVRPDIVFGADFIAGFPTETEDDFNVMLDFVKQSRIALLHVFPYSERSGTPAAAFKQLPKAVRKDRAEKLRKLGDTLKNKLMRSYIGKTVSVLLEENGRGYTETYLPVQVSSQLKNKIQAVKIEEVKEGVLYGIVVQ